MATIDSRYQSAYPNICDMLSSHKDTLNKLADKIFSKEEATFSFHLQYHANCHTYAELKLQNFTDLSKEIDAYNKNQTTKLLLTGAIAVACLVGAVANAVLGFAALGCTLAATLHYFPFDNYLNLIKIKAALGCCESTTDTLEGLNQIKSILLPVAAEFDSVDEAFYTSIYSQNLKYINSDFNEPGKRTTLLIELARELNKQGKLINVNTGKIYDASLRIIGLKFSEYLISGKYPQTLYFAKRFINQVTEAELEAGTLPQMTKPVGPVDLDIEDNGSDSDNGDGIIPKSPSSQPGDGK